MEELPRPFDIGDYHTTRLSAKYNLGPSDVESRSMQDILKLADPTTKALWDNLTLAYPNSLGNPLLREEVAQVYDVTKEDVLIVGSQDGLFVALTCLTNYLQKKQGGPIHAIFTYPCYQALSEPLTTNKMCETDRLEVKDTGTSWELSVEELKALIKPNTRLLVTNLPHSPTGYAPSKALWNDIVQVCKDNDMFLLSDEIYSWINRGEAFAPACVALKNGISMGGLAKTCGVPGLKVGWLCTTNREILRMMKALKDYTSRINCSPGEILGLITMRNRHALVAEARQQIESNLVMLKEFVKKHSDVLECHEVKAGTHTLIRLKGWSLELGQGTARGFCDVLFEEEKVGLVPASLYIYHREDYVRIGLGRKNMKEGLQCLGSFLDRHRAARNS